MELHRIMKDREMKNCYLLVLANKTDMAQGPPHILTRYLN